jgi:hypothetical protein
VESTVITSEAKVPQHQVPIAAVIIEEEEAKVYPISGVHDGIKPMTMSSDVNSHKSELEIKLT